VAAHRPQGTTPGIATAAADSVQSAERKQG